MCYYVQFPDLDPRIVRELNELDTHDTLTDFYKHRRTLAEIRDCLKSLNLKDVECWEEGNGVEARARVQAAINESGEAVTPGVEN